MAAVAATGPGCFTDPVMEALKHRGLVCGTLAEWLDQLLAGCPGGSAQSLLQHREFFTRAVVAQEWSTELGELLGSPPGRQVACWHVALPVCFVF
jgi:hypothetical protein